MMFSIIVFSHGAVHSNKNLLGGWLNLPLSKAGESDAIVLAKKLSMERIGVGFCSDLIRSKQVLVEVLMHHKSAQVIVDPRLRGRHFGKDFNSIQSLAQLNKNSRHAKENYYGDVLDGENLHLVSMRVFPFMNDVLRFMKKERVNVAISAHPDSLKLISQFLEGLDHFESSRINHDAKNYKKYVIDFK
ncbi:MAG: histidine phosphatase family protein [archaeon]